MSAHCFVVCCVIQGKCNCQTWQECFWTTICWDESWLSVRTLCTVALTSCYLIIKNFPAFRYWERKLKCHHVVNDVTFYTMLLPRSKCKAVVGSWTCRLWTLVREMSMRGTKRATVTRGEEPSTSKRRRMEPEDPLWQLRPVSDLKMSSIYNRSASEAPAELFRFVQHHLLFLIMF